VVRLDCWIMDDDGREKRKRVNEFKDKSSSRVAWEAAPVSWKMTAKWKKRVGNTLLRRRHHRDSRLAAIYAGYDSNQPDQTRLCSDCRQKEVS